MFDKDSYNNIISIIKPELDKVEGLISSFDAVYPDFDIALMEYFKAPSKKIRSVIVFLFFRALGFEINDNFIKLQAAIELIHNATLTHDDIIDNSNIRRGKETFNSKFDNFFAVISGDYLLSVALKYLLDLDSCEISKIFAKTIDSMCVGEISQYFNKFKLPKIDEYIEKSKFKTASLFIASFEAASILYNFDKNIAIDFATNFGVAFQIRDDILNFSNQDNKPIHNDYYEGIYTAPIIYADGNIENIKYGIEKANQLLDNYLCSCRDILCDNISCDNVYKQAILEILDLFKL